MRRETLEHIGKTRSSLVEGLLRIGAFKEHLSGVGGALGKQWVGSRRWPITLPGYATYFLVTPLASPNVLLGVRLELFIMFITRGQSTCRVVHNVRSERSKYV